MTKRQLYHLALTVILFGIAFGFNYYIRVAPQTDNYAAQVSNNLQKLEKEVEEVFDERGFIKRQISRANEEIKEGCALILSLLNRQS